MLTYTRVTFFNLCGSSKEGGRKCKGYYTWEVVFGDGRYIARHHNIMHKIENLYSICSSTTVIGNIYENSERLSATYCVFHKECRVVPDDCLHDHVFCPGDIKTIKCAYCLKSMYTKPELLKGE